MMKWELNFIFKILHPLIETPKFLQKFDLSSNIHTFKSLVLRLKHLVTIFLNFQNLHFQKHTIRLFFWRLMKHSIFVVNQQINTHLWLLKWSSDLLTHWTDLDYARFMKYISSMCNKQSEQCLYWWFSPDGE